MATAATFGPCMVSLFKKKLFDLLSTGTQGLAVTYCCHGEEENKLMGIAQKCSLSLSVLPGEFFLPFFLKCWMERVISSRLSFLVAIIEPGLMDDPCDWDVCAEAASPATLSKLSSGTERKKHAKSAVDPKSSSHRKPEKTPSVPAAAVLGEKTRGNEDHAQRQQQAAPTRKELQDALPKIPSLCSFKSRRPRFVTLEEAELDFRSFIGTGLGRSVDVIRDFRGQEDGEPSEESQSITLDDDSSECLKLCRTWRKSDFSHPSSAYGASSSRSDRGDGERASASESQTEPPQVTTAPEAKAEPKHIKSEAAAPREHPPHRESSAQPENCNDSGVVKHNRQYNQTALKQSARDESRKVRQKSGKQRKKVAERWNRETRERNEEERDEEEEEADEEWSPEAYWRASYRAWSDYYASMSAFQSQDYQSCYSAAHSWMAAYRMNAVYMEELLKD